MVDADRRSSRTGRRGQANFGQGNWLLREWGRCGGMAARDLDGTAAVSRRFLGKDPRTRDQKADTHAPRPRRRNSPALHSLARNSLAPKPAQEGTEETTGWKWAVAQRISSRNTASSPLTCCSRWNRRPSAAADSESCVRSRSSSRAAAARAARSAGDTDPEFRPDPAAGRGVRPPYLQSPEFSLRPANPPHLAHNRQPPRRCPGASSARAAIHVFSSVASHGPPLNPRIVVMCLYAATPRRMTPKRRNRITVRGLAGGWSISRPRSPPAPHRWMPGLTTSSVASQRGQAAAAKHGHRVRVERSANTTAAV